MLPAIVKLNEGHELPSYLSVRMHIAGVIYTVDVNEDDIDKLKDDPAIHSFEFAKRTFRARKKD